MSGWKYEFKVNFKGNWAKIFVSIENIQSFDCRVLVSRIRQKFQVKEVFQLKYLDADQDWVDLQINDYETFVDMIETAQIDKTRENIKKITLKVCEKEIGKRAANFSPSPDASVSSRVTRVPDDSRPSKPQRKKTKLGACRLLLDPATQLPELGYASSPEYVTPTQKYFDKLMQEIQESEHELKKKHDELSNIEQSFIEDINTPNRPLCTICHAPGHNRTNCNFAPCPSATICKQVKRHGDEEKYVRGMRAEIKEKTKK